MGIQYVLEKMKLKVQLNKYLSSIENTADYLQAKRILEPYCFNKQLFSEIQIEVKEAGTEDLLQYQIDKFEEYLKNYEEDSSKEVVCKHQDEEGLEI